MARIHLTHWNAEEAEARAATLRAAGHDVAVSADDGSRVCRRLRESPVDCLVIDLRRLPSQGSSTALEVRERKATRELPIVFIAGDPDKSSRIAARVPGAILTPWSRVRSAIRTAVRSAQAGNASETPSPPATAARDTSARATAAPAAGYSGRSLPAKLGIAADTRLILLGAPSDFLATLGELPAGVSIGRQARGAAATVLLFASERTTLEKRIDKAAAAVEAGGCLWVAWPKKSSGVSTDVTQALVRELGLATGLVDVKVAAIDATWSGHQFRHRRN